MDLVIVLVIIAMIVILCRDFKCVIYSLGIMEIFFRIMHFISDNIKIDVLSSFIKSFVPGSMTDIFARYSSGLLFSILQWIFVILMGVFVYYLVRYLIKRK